MAVRSQLGFFWLVGVCGGCANVHSAEVVVSVADDAAVDAAPAVDAGPESDATVDASAPVVSLDECLGAGGALVEVARVNNNDMVDHGTVRAFDVSELSELAVATDDGFIKFWTLDGFVGAVSGSRSFAYGGESFASNPTDIAFGGPTAYLGNAQGLVSAWESDGTNSVVGGAAPGTAIVAVAYEPSSAFLAHAEDVVGGNIMVRGVAFDTRVFGPLETSVSSVMDLRFLPNGDLVIAGTDAAHHLAVEVRHSSEFELVLARATAADFGLEDEDVSGLEIATERHGVVLALQTNAASARHGLFLSAGDLSLRSSVVLNERVESPVTASVTFGGDFAVATHANADGRNQILVFNTHTGTESGSFAATDLPDALPMSVRVHQVSNTVFVAYQSGQILALRCSAAAAP